MERAVRLGPPGRGRRRPLLSVGRGCSPLRAGLSQSPPRPKMRSIAPTRGHRSCAHHGTSLKAPSRPRLEDARSAAQSLGGGWSREGTMQSSANDRLRAGWMSEIVRWPRRLLRGMAELRWRGGVVKHMILLYGSQQAYDAMAGRPPTRRPCRRRTSPRCTPSCSSVCAGSAARSPLPGREDPSRLEERLEVGHALPPRSRESTTSKPPKSSQRCLASALRAFPARRTQVGRRRCSHRR